MDTWRFATVADRRELAPLLRQFRVTVIPDGLGGYGHNAALLVVRGLFLGKLLPMTAVAGILYQEASARLCNSYRLDEQEFVGQLLVGLAGAAAAAWLGRLAWRTMRAARASLRGPAGA